MVLIFFIFLSLQAHKVGVYYKNLASGRQESDSSSAGPSCQPRIDDAIHKQARDAYRKLLRTAYNLAQSGQPLSNFKTLVKTQKENGVRLVEGCEGTAPAREFIHEIADAIREKVAVLLCTATAFSVLSDGSEARKTGTEKELVLVRTVRNGLATYFVLGLQDIDSYGDADATNLKKSVDDAFKDKLKMPNDR